MPPETSTEFASSREQIRVICLGVSKLKQIFDLGKFAIVKYYKII